MNYRQTSLGKQSEVVTVTKSEWKTIGIRIKAKDLPVFNRRLSSESTPANNTSRK